MQIKYEKCMEITKEIFFDFLQKHNFYDGWIEGYNLDNELYADIIPLDEYFKNTPIIIWLYNGPSVMATHPVWADDASQELKDKWQAWRDKYMSLYMDTDELWMNFVNNIDNNEK